jgi:hypothetical protein
MPGKKSDAVASQKPIGPSPLSVTEALAGTFVATVFKFAKQNTVTPEVLNDAWALMHERMGIAQIEGTNRAPPPPPADDSTTATAATAQEIWTALKELVGGEDLFLLDIAALGNNENGEHTSVQKMHLSALGKQLVAKIPNLKTGRPCKRKEGGGARLRDPAKEAAAGSKRMPRPRDRLAHQERSRKSQ